MTDTWSEIEDAIRTLLATSWKRSGPRKRAIAPMWPASDLRTA